MSYTAEKLSSMSVDTLLNIITSLCDSGVPEYLQEVRQARAELTRRGERVRLVKEPSRYYPGKTNRVAHLVGK
jgi:hypothetical protein